MKHLAFATGVFVSAAGIAAAETPELVVYTYDSFVSEWGPGPQIEAAFEEVCGCDLKFVAAGDGAGLLSRLRLEGARTEADIVLGLDTNLTAAAKETGLFAPHSVSAEYSLPVDWADGFFVPYDWGYFAFVHQAEFDAPVSFKALAGSDAKILIQDPRSSTPGLGLLMWVKAAYGEEAPAIWEGLADNIVTVTKGWSEAYGLFLEGEADMVLSYTTSLAYHMIAEDDHGKKAALFEAGHYLQVEVAGNLDGSDVPELADSFLEFMVTDAFQSVIPTTNWMYPAVTPEAGLPEGFESLVQPEKALLLSADEAAGIRAEALEEWRAALSQ